MNKVVSADEDLKPQNIKSELFPSNTVFLIFSGILSMVLLYLLGRFLGSDIIQDVFFQVNDIQSAINVLLISHILLLAALISFNNWVRRLYLFQLIIEIFVIARSYIYFYSYFPTEIIEFSTDDTPEWILYLFINPILSLFFIFAVGIAYVLQLYYLIFDHKISKKFGEFI